MTNCRGCGQLLAECECYNTGVDATLKERGKTYGSYKENVKAVAAIMKSLNDVHKDMNGVDMNLIDHCNLQYLVIKLVRLGATPSHLDSLHDMQGYAKLIEEYYA